MEIDIEETQLIKGYSKLQACGIWRLLLHIDSTAYTHVKNTKHFTLLIAVDPANIINGGLEIFAGSHRMEVPIDQKKKTCLEVNWVKEQARDPIELEVGMNLV